MIPKFRAWDKEDKEMLEVHGINFDANGIWTREMIDDESDGNFLFFDEVELMQSTGLKDKNGIEIYEGDVVKSNRTQYGRFIGFVDSAVAKFEVRGVKQYAYLSDDLNGVYEVIGNKYEHPHLLEDN